MEHARSIFSQKLDRVAFTAYFLGAVVPLVALAVVVERFVLREITDRLATLGLLAAVCSIAVLSLASFLTLRRTTRRSLERIDRDNGRLATLLEVAESLAAAQHGSDAARTAARCALGLTGSRACYVLGRGEPGAAPTRLAAVGENAEKLEQELVEPLVGLANLVLSNGRPALRGPEQDCSAMAATPLPGEAAPAGVIVAVAHEGTGAFQPDQVNALATLGGFAAVALRNAELKDAQRNFFTHVTDMLVAALDSHLGYHTGHGARVAHQANRVGRKLGLDDHRLERLHFGALLHDVGMLKLERHLQIDPKSAAKHTVLGARMLGRIQLWRDLAPIVQHHHEWWDGSGYPDGLSGTAIPLESRIVALCEVFDTITSASSYKEPLAFDGAVTEIESGAGTQFDPEVVSAFVELVREGVLGPDSD
jgi:putative nucleotidyltransferase with HDIG domain